MASDGASGSARRTLLAAGGSGKRSAWRSAGHAEAGSAGRSGSPRGPGLPDRSPLRGAASRLLQLLLALTLAAALRSCAIGASSSPARPLSRSTIVSRCGEPFFSASTASRRTAAFPSALTRILEQRPNPVDRGRMVAREQLDGEQRRSARRRALVVEPAPQQLLLRAPVELPDGAIRDRALAEVLAAGPPRARRPTRRAGPRAHARDPSPRTPRPARLLPRESPPRA